MNFLGAHHQTAKHIKSAPFFIDFDRCRALIPSGKGSRVTHTAIADIVGITVRAVEYDGEWPVVGGINGNTFTVEEEIALGEKARGKCFSRWPLD